jgi:hypothetical protein
MQLLACIRSVAKRNVELLQKWKSQTADGQNVNEYDDFVL